MFVFLTLLEFLLRFVEFRDGFRNNKLKDAVKEAFVS